MLSITGSSNASGSLSMLYERCNGLGGGSSGGGACGVTGLGDLCEVPGRWSPTSLLLLSDKSGAKGSSGGSSALRIASSSPSSSNSPTSTGSAGSSSSHSSGSVGSTSSVFCCSCSARNIFSQSVNLAPWLVGDARGEFFFPFREADGRARPQLARRGEGPGDRLPDIGAARSGRGRRPGFEREPRRDVDGEPPCACRGGSPPCLGVVLGGGREVGGMKEGPEAELRRLPEGEEVDPRRDGEGEVAPSRPPRLLCLRDPAPLCGARVSSSGGSCGGGPLTSLLSSRL
mmetsp:Transcript_34419/g.78511  ORF Transcript_34419/g.78511 Transcript_34419/m.78511 type:complete len:287 (-) Transcript_34419:709-1569(-)